MMEFIEQVILFGSPKKNVELALKTKIPLEVLHKNVKLIFSFTFFMASSTFFMG